ncbi:replication factor RFC1 C terminal domain-containing protein [Gigaspora rosea]|uniref:Replication factor C subunit 1 n=1 Tax=Gigaspora rosea TaxID=44941 RepID=A0A397V607_9GLOM|nr:replication factor RFC1 C terminal domain-containing protein [Gigaspora rosea]
MDTKLDQSENVPEEPKMESSKSKSSKRAKEEDSYSEAPKKKLPKTTPSAPEPKEIPQGAINCLLGKTFVFTGDLENLTREDAQDLVKSHGGRVTTAPSSRTSYVVVGDNPGPNKLEKIKQHNIPTLNEDELLDLIRNAPAQIETPQPTPAKGKSRASDDMEISEPTPSSSSTTPLSQLWSDKYKPRSLKELCGNKSAVDNLQKWLKAWESNLKTGFDFNSKFPAVLLAGPPGIGKTTAAHLIGKLEGYDVKEFNASDTRSKKALEMAVKTVTHNTSIKGFFQPERSETEVRKMGRTLIIMDEVDGMSAGDRGGVAELVQLIKKTQIPIICICNEKGKKLQSLTNVCQEIRFQKPRVEQVRSRIMTIASREDLKFSQPNIADEIITGANADIRQILNRLSSWKLSNDSINYNEGKALNKASEKNVILDPFDITSRLFGTSIWNNRAGNVNDKLELYYHESDILPLMIHENYLKIKPHINSNTIERDDVNPDDLEQIAILEAISKAAASISDGAMCDSMIHGSQPQWSLMPVHGIFSCVIPTYYVHGINTSGARYAFPSSLGQISRTNKYKRILREIQIHMRLKVSGDKNEIRQSYLPALFTALSQPLIEKGSDGISEVIKLMDQYYLNKDDWDAIMELSFGGDKTLKEIDKSVKAAFTKKYNSSSHPVPFLKASSVKSSKTAAASVDVPDFEDAMEVEEVAKEEEVVSDDDEDLSKDKFIKQKSNEKSNAATSTRRTSTGTKTRGGRGGGRKAVRKIK